MAKFKTRYSELGFYADGSLHRFNNGIYITNNKEQIAVLKKMKDVTEIVEKKAGAKKTATKTKTKPKTTPKPTAKK